MEELDLILELSVLVDANGRVGRLRSDELEEGIYANALHKLPMPFKCLYLRVFAELDAPEDRGAIKRPRHKVLRVIGPL